MGDLISRSALFRKSFVVDGHRVVSYLDIIEAPAAYDVDKVASFAKQAIVKKILQEMCGEGDGCLDCRFFKPEDDTDGEYFCMVRDKDGCPPFEDEWDMESAMLSE